MAANRRLVSINVPQEVLVGTRSRCCESGSWLCWAIASRMDVFWKVISFFLTNGVSRSFTTSLLSAFRSSIRPLLAGSALQLYKNNPSSSSSLFSSPRTWRPLQYVPSSGGWPVSWQSHTSCYQLPEWLSGTCLFASFPFLSFFASNTNLLLLLFRTRFPRKLSRY